MRERLKTGPNHQINVQTADAFFRTFPVKLSFKDNVTLDT